MISKTLAQIAAHQAAIPWMTCLGLLIFVTFFVCMLMWTVRPKNAPLYQEMSLKPLEENES
jgi:hypothetical protein